MPPLILDQVTPVYDWRELQRWGVNEAVLPADSIIRFREPGFLATSTGGSIAGVARLYPPSGRIDGRSAGQSLPAASRRSRGGP